MPLGDGKVLGMWLCGSDGCALGRLYAITHMVMPSWVYGIVERLVMGDCHFRVTVSILCGTP